MHKKIEAELVQLANSILKMENNDNMLSLHKKAQEIYEKLTVLKFVNESLNTSLNDKVEEKSDEFIEEKVELVDEELKTEVENSEMFVEDEVEEVLDEENNFEEDEISKTVPIEVIVEDEEEVLIEFEKPTIKEVKEATSSLKLLFEDEFKDAVSADVATTMFEKVTKENPVAQKIEEVEIKKKSLNDALFSGNIQVGLNDRIAFVKFLFDGSQEDFNRVLSQLNSFKVYEEAIGFIDEFVKPDYNWKGKEEYEERLKSLIERKFS